MVEKEEAVMAALVLVMSLLLLVLLFAHPRSVASGIWSTVKGLYGLDAEETTTTEPPYFTSTPSTQASTTTAPYKLVSPKEATSVTQETSTTQADFPAGVTSTTEQHSASGETSTTFLAGPSATSSSASTTSTTARSVRRCRSEADCGTVSTIGCKGNTIWNFTTIFTCKDRGSDTSYCLGRQKDKAILKCEIYEKCTDGYCLKVYNNECDYLCDLDGYDSYYCHDGSCPSGDVQMDLDGGPCSGYSDTCCCYGGISPTTTSTTVPS